MYFDLAILTNPKFEEAYNNKGYMLAELKKYEEAMKLFDKAIEIDP